MSATGTAIRQNVASNPVGIPSIATSTAIGTACNIDLDEHGDRGVEPERIGHRHVGVLGVADDEVGTDRSCREQWDDPGDDRNGRPATRPGRRIAKSEIALEVRRSR